MKPALTFLLALIALTFIPSCGGFHADVTNPTVSQMDALDVQWGLEPRKPKGGARNNAVIDASNAIDSNTVRRPTPVDPSIIQSLR